MSIIFGVFARDETVLPEKWGAAMAQASLKFPCDHLDIVSTSSAILGCRQRYNTPQSPFAKQPVKADDQDIYLLFDGRLDNRESLAAELMLPLTSDTSDEELILRCYQKFGSEVAHHLLGDFAIALYDAHKRKSLLVRDHMGVRPLHIAHNEHYLAFSSHQGALLALPWVNREINEQWIADYLEVCPVSQTNTIYQGITAVRPAHSIENNAGIVTQSKYWELQANRACEEKSEAENVADFRAILEKAIACRSRCYGELSSEFSGGLDSSMITAFAKQHEKENDRKLVAYSQVSPPEAIEYAVHPEEEVECLESFRQMHPDIIYSAHHGEHLSVVDAYRYSCDVHSAPSLGDITLLGKDIHEHMQKHGRRVVFSGWGGDQCATFRGNNWILEATNSRDWDYLRNEFRYYFSSGLLRLAMFQILRNSFSRWIWKGYRKLKKSWSRATFKLATRPSFHRKFGYPQRSYGAFSPDPGLGAKARLRHLITKPSIAYHAANSNLGAASYGVEYRYPLLDIRLLEYCLALPVRMHRKNGINRFISREAMEGVVPDRIRFGIPKSIPNIPSSLHCELREQETIVNILKQWQSDSAILRFIDLNEAINAAVQISPKQRNNVGGKGNLSRRIMMLGHWLDVYYGRSAS